MWLPRIKSGPLDTELKHIIRSSGGGECFATESVQEEAGNELGRNAGEGHKYQASKYLSKYESGSIMNTTLHYLGVAPFAPCDLCFCYNRRDWWGWGVGKPLDYLGQEVTLIISAYSSSAIMSHMALN